MPYSTGSGVKSGVSLRSHCKQFSLVKLTWNPPAAPEWKKNQKEKNFIKKQ